MPVRAERSWGWARRLGVGALLAWAAPAWAVDTELVEQVSAVTERVGELEQSADKLRRNVAQRSGLMGVQDAVDKYDRIYADYLLAKANENPVQRRLDLETAAVHFYALLASGALGDGFRTRDVEYLFADCVSELGNDRFALQLFDGIVRRPDHPNFKDAVRRALETSAKVDGAAFRRYYTDYVASGRIEATDEVMYTLAKSYYVQGQLTQAKEAFEQVGKDSEWHSRALYFLGVIMLREGNLVAAASYFAGVVDAPVKPSDQDATRELARQQEDVRELARLAIARVELERGNFAAAQQRYEQIAPTSPYNAERMYELIWTLIRQDKWAEALQSIDGFILSYGAERENRYTARLQLLRGYIYLEKNQDFVRAPQAYEDAAGRYRRDLEDLRRAPRTPEQLRSLLDGVSGSATVNIPGYMLDSLRGDAIVLRAGAVRDEVARQDGQISANEKVAADVSAAIGSGAAVLKGFEKVKTELLTTRGGLLGARDRLLDAEVRHLRSKMPSALKGDIAAFQEARARLAGALADADSAAMAGSDVQSAYVAQVEAVQEQARLLTETVVTAQQELEGLRKRSATKTLPDDVAKVVREGLAAQETELGNLGAEVPVLGSDLTRARIVALAPVPAGAASGSDRASMLGAYGEFRERLRAWRRYASDAESQRYFADIDALWARVDAAELVTDAADRASATAEARDLAAVRQQISRELEVITAIRGTYGSDSALADGVVLRAVGRGLDALDGRYASVVMDAEKGLTDVYWKQKDAAIADVEMLNNTAVDAEQARARAMFDAMNGPEGAP